MIRFLKIAALVFSISAVSSGCMFMNKIAGKTYNRDAYSYAFTNEHATLTYSGPETWMCFDVPGAGDAIGVSSGDNLGDRLVWVLPRRGYLNVYRIDKDADVTFNMNGSIFIDDESFYSNVRIVQGDESVKSGTVDKENMISILENLRDNEFAMGSATVIAINLSGEKVTGKDAVLEALEILKSDSDRDFAIFFNATCRTFKEANEPIAMAEVPVKYGEKTVALDYSKATYFGDGQGFGGNFQAAYMEELIAAKDTVVFRVEDDGFFLFNPETESRWKRDDSAPPAK